MRTCVFINESRTSLITADPSEPVLAEASARLLNHPKLSWEKFLAPLVSLLKQGAVEEGYRGELVARILLLHAYDPACLEQLRRNQEGQTAASCANTFNQVITLTQCLQHLLDAKILDNPLSDKEEDSLLARLQASGLAWAYVRFNHFSPHPHDLRINRGFVHSGASPSHDK